MKPIQLILIFILVALVTYARRLRTHHYVQIPSRDLLNRSHGRLIAVC